MISPIARRPEDERDDPADHEREAARIPQPKALTRSGKT
jgi:hypothetical protein